MNEQMLFKEGTKCQGDVPCLEQVQPKDRNKPLSDHQPLCGLSVHRESLDTILPMSVNYPKDGDTSGALRDIPLHVHASGQEAFCATGQLPELVDEILATIEPD
ncbi:hypothetical protein [Duncaniella muris]|uniref:hypothetical protein n=1 Tax=Duncaniella muris TaxID=2094150 RepID=UPI003F6614F9